MITLLFVCLSASDCCLILASRYICIFFLFSFVSCGIKGAVVIQHFTCLIDQTKLSLRYKPHLHMFIVIEILNMAINFLFVALIQTYPQYILTYQWRTHQENNHITRSHQIYGN